MRALWRLVFLILSGVALLGGSVQCAKLAFERGWLPAAYNPFGDLDVRAEPNVLTDFKRWRAARDPAFCQRALASSDLRTVAVPDFEADGGCGMSHGYRILRGQAALSSSFLASCPLALGYAMFEQHRLQPAAQRIFGRSVQRVEHYGSYACRNVNHAKAGRLSQHARANALDLAAFVLADGRRITVLHDWHRADDAGRFLTEVFDGACASFRIVLGPDYNALHRNHFHVDMGGFHFCR